jgi:hypothetical protein
MSQFKKGESGNPAGRPKGIKDRRILFAEMLDKYKKELFDKAIELALAGNEQMLRLLLDRLLPAKPKDNPLPEIGGLEGDAAKQCDKVMELVTERIITPYEANSLLNALVSKTNLIEIAEIKQAVVAISETLKLRGNKK